jgi:hypothetical protein
MRGGSIKKAPQMEVKAKIKPTFAILFPSIVGFFKKPFS